MRIIVAYAGLVLGGAMAAACGDEGGAERVGEVEQALCPIGPAFPSCHGACGTIDCSPAFPDVCCACDDGCAARGDCCCDFEDECPDLVPEPDSCAGICGTQAPAGCWCDAQCTGFDDCCDDFTPECADWLKPISGPHIDRGSALAADARGNTYVVTKHGAPIDLGGGEIPIVTAHLVVTSFDPLGGHRWSRMFEFSDKFELSAAVTDASSVYLVGTFIESVELDGVTILPATDGWAFPVVVALSSASGAFRWAKVHKKMNDASLALYGTAQDIELAPDGRLAFPVKLFKSSLGTQRQIVRLRTTGALETYAPISGSYPRRLASDASGRHVLVDTFTLRQVLATGATGWTRNYTVRWKDVTEAASGATVAVGECASTTGCTIGATTVPHGAGVFVRHDAAGAVSWVQTIAPFVSMKRIVTDAAGHFHATARSYDHVEMAGQSAGVDGNDNTYVIELTSAGALVRIELVGTATYPDSVGGGHETMWDYEVDFDDLAVSPNGARIILDQFFGTPTIRGTTLAPSDWIDFFITSMP